MNINRKDLIKHWKALAKWFSSLDWKNPRIILTTIVLVVLPFVAKYYVMAGLLLGLLLSVMVLWLLDKGPLFLRRMCVKYPFFADILLSSLVVTSIGTFFGSGLTLGLGAVFTALILSWALTELNIADEKVATS